MTPLPLKMPGKAFRPPAKQEDTLPDMKLAAFCAALCILAAPNAPARAAVSFYLGTWKLTGAAAAPWATQSLGARSPRGFLAKRSLLRRRGSPVLSLSSARDRIISSAIIAPACCSRVRSRRCTQDKTADPNKIAASLGFSGANVKTLETGCEFDFHFVDAVTAKIGLNDYVYTLSKQ